MDIYTLPAFVVVISIIVVIHELGHYWMGRLFNAKIDVFSIGMGPELFGWNDKLGTRWKVCALPVGGYVKFHGDENAASVPDFEELDNIRDRMMSEGQDPNRIFHLKPLYQRALIILAGPLANFVLAIALFAGFYTIIGEPLHDVIVEELVEESPAEKAGVLPGDQIIAIDGWKIFSFGDLKNQVSSASDKSLRFTISRSGESLDLMITPVRTEMEYEDQRGVKRVLPQGLIGIRSKQVDPADVETFHHSLWSALTRGYQQTVWAIDRTFHYLGGIIVGREKADQLGGPLRIAQMSGEVAQMGLDKLVIFISFVSISVGLVNLFPIPILDGGHLLFYGIEAIQGRPLSHRVQEFGFRIGLIVLALVFIFVTWNDIQFLWPGATS